MSLTLGEAAERARAARLAVEVERLTRELAAEKAALAETADRFGVECAEHDQELEAADATLAERTRERDDARRRTEHLLGELSWAEATAAKPMDPETTEEPKP